MDKKIKSPFSTFIRNFYSDSLSSLMVSYYKTNLSFRLDPFISKDSTGRSSYDYKNGLTTTVNYDGAAALYIVANDILNGKEGVNGMILTIPGASGASLILERKPFSANGQSEQMETFLCITKNNMTIPFKFIKYQVQFKENGQMIPRYIESGLGIFAMTIEGYLTGIGADRHLDKLPEDFDDIEDVKQLTPFTTGNSGYQISYGNYQNTPLYGQA